MMPASFRLPPNVEGKAEPEVVELLGFHDDAITDLQQANKTVCDRLSAAEKAGTPTTTTTENVTTNSETTIINPSTIGGVNNQTGATSYTTQPSDYGLYVLLNDASPVAVQLAQGTSIQVPWFATFINQGAGLATLTPAVGTISYPNNLGAVSMPIPQFMAAVVVYDGTNFDAVLFPVPPQNTPAVDHQWLASFNSITGAFTQAQPSISDVSGLAAALALLAPIASPTFTGTVTQPDATKLTSPTTATSATAGSASTLPATPAGYLQVSLGGTDFRIPYYAV